MIKEYIYESPEIVIVEIIPESLLCQSSLEGLDENTGSWG